MQGANSRNITKQVVATLRDEVSQLVGHPIEVGLDHVIHCGQHLFEYEQNCYHV